MEETISGEPLVEEQPVEEIPERVSFMDKLPNMRSYQNRRLIRRLSLIIGGLLIPLLVCGYYVSPFSKLQKIQVVGNQHVSTATILKASTFEKQGDFFHQFMKRHQTIEAIQQKNPRIKSVAVTIVGINQLKIVVSEYKEIAQLAKNQKYYPILENGTVVKSASESVKQGMVTLENFNNEKKILTTIEEYAKLPQSTQSAISQVIDATSQSNDELIHLIMNDGNTVVVNTSNMSKQMQYYPKIAKNLPEKGTIDMEVGIFYAPYQSSTTSSSDATDEQHSTETHSEEAQSSSSSSSSSQMNHQ